MNRLEKIFDAKKDTSEGIELEVPGILIEKNEDENFAVEFPDLIKATSLI
jgi:HTH-type transcriptional regulator/antitoxin HigA